MGVGRLCSKLRAADLDQHDGLAPLDRQLGHFHELAGVLKAFDKPGDDFGGVVVEEVPDEVGEVQVCFVAGGDDVGEPDAVVRGAAEERTEGRRSALAYQPYLAAQSRCAQGRRAGPDVVLQVGHPQAVGAGEPEARLPGKGTQLVLQLPAVVHAPFGKPGRNDDRRAGAPPVALPQHFQHPVVGNHDAHQVWGFRKVGHAGVAPDPHYLVVARVDRVDTDPVFGLQGCGEEPPAVL